MEIKHESADIERDTAEFVVGSHIDSISQSTIDWFLNLFCDDESASVSSAPGGAKRFAVSLNNAGDAKRFIEAR